MERISDLYIDPEEDEIFFYEITEKEAEARTAVEKKSLQLKSDLQNHKYAGQIVNNYEDSSNSAEKDSRNIDKNLTSSRKLDVIDSEELICNMHGEEQNCDYSERKNDSGHADICRIEITQHKEENTRTFGNENTESKENMKDQTLDLLVNNLKVLVDQSFTTPVKDIIDKSIFKTPKSIVKADKDGGFLKVLSEIALAKAEVDENSLKEVRKQNDIPVIRETNDHEGDDKENLKTEIEMVNFLNEMPPNKSYQGSLVGSTNYENLNMKNCADSLPNTNEVKGINFNTPLLENSDIFEADNERNCEKVHKTEFVIDSSKNIEHRLLEEPFNVNVEKVKQEIEEGKTSEADMKNISNNLESLYGNKMFLNRNTVRLLQEVNQIMVQEQTKRESHGNTCVNLAEEAEKVIEKLRTFEFDDSWCSPDQYLDLDKTNVSFFNSEITDAFKDTLSKPFSQITNKDVELLLGKLSFNTCDGQLDNEIHYPSKLNETKKCASKLTSQTVNESKNTVCHENQNLDAIKKNTVNCNGIPNTGTKKLKSNTKSVVVVKCQSEIKNLPRQPAFKARVCQSNEKNLKAKNVTRIPKLVSTASKKLFSGHEAKLENVRVASSKTPSSKIRSLKFNDVKSPVNLYINSKTPVLITKVKAKPEPVFNIWKKHLETNTKQGNIQKKQPKFCTQPNFPVVNYRSATPLSIDESPRSHLPRLTPKMQKLIGSNSPVVVKHTGRVQLITPGKCQIGMNDTSIELNPNEVSVVIRKVAQTSQAKK